MSEWGKVPRHHRGSHNWSVYSAGVADKTFWHECVNPPTTAEWLSRLRRAGEKKIRTWSKARGWREQYRPRAFIRPLGLSRFPVNEGYWWRKLP